MNPLEFKGGLDIILAHDWIFEMERVFQVVQCTKEDKVIFAPQMMKDPTARWWASTATRMVTLGIPKDWKHFKVIYLDNIFPSILRAQKEFEFQLLRQGSMCVEKCAERFEDMDAYSRQVAYEPYEKWKIDQFMFGLRGEIEHSVAQREFDTYAELLRQFYIDENSLKKIHTKREQANPLQINYSRVVHHLKPKGLPSKGKKMQSVGLMSPQQCSNCNRLQFGK